MEQSSALDRYKTLEDILKVLPHREPFVFVDKVESLTIDEKIIISKMAKPSDCMTIDEEKFFPQEFLLEVLGQAAILLFYAEGRKADEITTMLVGVDDCEVSGSIKAGSNIKAEIWYEKVISKAAILRGLIKVDDKLILETKMTVAFMKV